MPKVSIVPPVDSKCVTKNNSYPNDLVQCRNFFANNSMFARLGTDYEIRNQWFFAILEAMTTD